MADSGKGRTSHSGSISSTLHLEGSCRAAKSPQDQRITGRCAEAKPSKGAFRRFPESVPTDPGVEPTSQGQISQPTSTQTSTTTAGPLPRTEVSFHETNITMVIFFLHSGSRVPAKALMAHAQGERGQRSQSLLCFCTQRCRCGLKDGSLQGSVSSAAARKSPNSRLQWTLLARAVLANAATHDAISERGPTVPSWGQVCGERPSQETILAGEQAARLRRTQQPPGSCRA